MTACCSLWKRLWFIIYTLVSSCFDYLSYVTPPELLVSLCIGDDESVDMNHEANMTHVPVLCCIVVLSDGP